MACGSKAAVWDGSDSNWITTISGARIDLSHPDPDQMTIDDIAHALGNQCRYTGHVSHHYSVAEHCLHVAALVPPQYRLAALLHDAQEAYISDLSTPMKAEVGGAYRVVEARIVEALDRRFQMGGRLMVLPEPVALADRVMLMTERDFLIGASLAGDWGPHYEDTLRVPNWKPMYADTPALARAHYAKELRRLLTDADKGHLL